MRTKIFLSYKRGQCKMKIFMVMVMLRALKSYHVIHEVMTMIKDEKAHIDDQRYGK